MKKYILLVATLVVLQGCSTKESFTTEQLQNLTKSAKVTDYEKSEFDTANNKLKIYTTRELVSKEDFNKELESLQINSLDGKTLQLANIKVDNFSGRDFNIEVVSKNNNSVSFNIKDSDNKTYNLPETKYSESYVKNKINILSKNLITFDELAGTLEIDLQKGAANKERVEKFKTISESVNTDIQTLKTFTSENSNYNKLDELSNKISSLERLVPLMQNAVNSSVANGSASQITVNFLVINDIDKIARDLEKM